MRQCRSRQGVASATHRAIAVVSHERTAEPVGTARDERFTVT